MKKVHNGQLGGIPVRDGSLDLSLSVLQCDIESAIPRDPTNCVIALASGRLGPGTEVSIGAAFALVRMPGDGVHRRYVLSPDTRRKVREFDKTGIFPPGTVTLKAPVGVRRLGKHGKALPTPRAPGSRHGGRFTRQYTQPLRHLAAPAVPTAA